MNTKRIGKWVIVLFLLAALPGMTAVMAQGQEPAVAQPAAGCNVTESEPNDSQATADLVQIGDVICGAPEYDNDAETCGPDVFRFHLSARKNVLIHIPSWPYNTNNRLCLSGYGCMELNFDEILLRSLSPGDYYLSINNSFGEDCTSYAIALSEPLLISAAAAGLGSSATVGGIQFRSEDILAWSHLNNGEERWIMLLDGSNVGITKNVTNIALDGSEDFLLGLAANQTLPDVGVVTPWDIVVYRPTYYEPYPAGTFQMGLKGSQHQLTTAAEKLDAIDGWTNGYDRCFGYPVSTAGVASVTGWLGVMKQDDEDVFCKTYNNGWQPYDWFFDVKGKNNAPSTEPAAGRVPGLPAEDVIAMAYDDVNDQIFLVIQGSGTIHGHQVTQKDIFALNYPSYSWGGVVWHGPDHGWNYNIDAIEMSGR